ncbi:hypothetical protein ROHU_004035 [Labeo rohita]|uniref:Uncharacterized protein n=1 Tax=Labeo rohita TaxID=84645 RepID=A0A498NQP5_LABRO|nr:hypothetical protein ROHU_004035 [Labeo rohita]
MPTRVELTWASTARKAPPGAQHPRLRRSVKSRSRGRQPTPVPTRVMLAWGCGLSRTPPHGRRTYTSRYILVSRRRVKGPSPPETSLRGRGSRPRRARGRGALPGPPRYPCGGWRFDPSCVLPNPTGRPGNTRGEARRPFFRPYLVLVPDPSSHGAGGLGLIPRPPESSLRGLAPLEKPPPGAQQPRLRRSVKSPSRGRQPTPVPTRVELTWASTARKAPPGAQHPRLRRSVKSRSRGRQPTPVPTRVKLAWGCGLSRTPPGRRTYTSRYVLVSRRRVKGPSPPETSLRGRGSRPRRARERGPLSRPASAPREGWKFDPSCKTFNRP